MTKSSWCAISGTSRSAAQRSCAPNDLIIVSMSVISSLLIFGQQHHRDSVFDGIDPSTCLTGQYGSFFVLGQLAVVCRADQYVGEFWIDQAHGVAPMIARIRESAEST